MAKHARLGASTSDIWLNCSGAPALWEEAPEQPESVYAEEGTAAHGVAERWLRHRLKTPSQGFVPPKTISKGDLEAIRVFVDDVWKDYTTAKGSQMVIEKRVDLSNVIAPEMFGTVDAGVVEEFGHLIVNDYKHGRGVGVDIYKENALGFKTLNTQAVYYALGLAAEYDFNFDQVTLKITQPRYANGPAIKSVTIHISELMRYIDLFKRGVERTMKPGARRTPGPWCRFCRAKSICRESKSKYRTDVRSDFD